MLRPYPIPRLLLYCSPPPCCPALIILHHPPRPLSCWLIVTFRLKNPRRVCVAILPGRAYHRGARQRLAWARIFVPGLVAAGSRVAPSCPGAWRRHNQVAAGVRASSSYPGAHRHPQLGSCRDAGVGVSSGRSWGRRSKRGPRSAGARPGKRHCRLVCF